LAKLEYTRVEQLLLGLFGVTPERSSLRENTLVVSVAKVEQPNDNQISPHRRNRSPARVHQPSQSEGSASGSRVYTKVWGQRHE